ncbi:MAG: sel1 repeat family protein, partial [Proteobacteria bacterium]|nr:sel1 repeat family protein [Pseudomonadota bacterium]
MSKKSELAACLLLVTLVVSPAHAQQAQTGEAASATSEATKTYPEEALRWLRAGKRFYEGGTRLVPKDHQQAKSAFEKAAEYNHPEALYYLGNLYQNGEDVPHDSEQPAT